MTGISKRSIEKAKLDINYLKRQATKDKVNSKLGRLLGSIEEPHAKRRPFHEPQT
ncbi:MAG: hypothetical protein WED05_09905 [Candidatus Atabeyarchaeum deiterrae]